MQAESSGQSPVEANSPEAVEQQQSFYVASSERRFVNFVVDFVGSIVFSLLLCCLIGLIFAFLGIDTDAPDWSKRIADILMRVLWIVALLLYYYVQEHFWGQTFGKFLTRTMVIAADGERSSGKQIIGRTLSRFIPAESFSYLLGGPFPIGWHDRLSKTRVVNKTPNPNP